MDGNGRWAKKRGLPRFLGHRQGVDALKKAVRFASDIGIGTLTVYAFSTENWQRPQAEVNFLLDLMYKTFVSEIEELRREGVRIFLIGDRQTISEEIAAVWDKAEALTKENKGLTLNVAFNYGGRQEITAAARSLAKKVAAKKLTLEDITEDTFQKELYTRQSPDLDLIIRTGGESRLSNFLLWQAAYSEIYITDTLWPDFGPKDFARALQDFSRRERRFGLVPVKENID
ncbi:MAG TPA: di-trans,poly-cis-decaprenylcistransferase [Firmicutes bacterium]|nr:di-trans,poly-cis-decaprenylcistransferase [Bacillota bacterium]